MTATFCTVTGNIVDLRGAPLQNYPLRFELVAGSYVGEVQIPQQDLVVETDGHGDFTTQLWCSGEGAIATGYRLHIPHDVVEFSIPGGTTAATLSSLRVANDDVPATGTPQYNLLLSFVEGAVANIGTTAIVASLKADTEFIALAKGEPGPPGVDGVADNTAIATTLAADADFQTAVTGPPGLDGADGTDGVDGVADNAVVAATLAADATFQAAVTGPQGAPGAPGADGVDGVADNAAVAATLAADAAFQTAVTGPPGTDGVDGTDGAKGDPGDPGANGADAVADNAAIAATLAADTTFQTTVTGPEGPQGLPGTNGADGAKGDKGDQGDPGADADNTAITAALAADTNFQTAVTGPQGPEGPPGADGAGAGGSPDLSALAPFFDDLGWTLKSFEAPSEAGSSKGWAVPEITYTRISFDTDPKGAVERVVMPATAKVSFRVATPAGFITTGHDGADLSSEQQDIDIAWGFNADGSAALSNISTQGGDTGDGVVYRLFFNPSTQSYAVLLPQKVETSITNAYYRSSRTPLVIPPELDGYVLLALGVIGEASTSFTYVTHNGYFGWLAA